MIAKLALLHSLLGIQKDESQVKNISLVNRSFEGNVASKIEIRSVTKNVRFSNYEIFRPSSAAARIAKMFEALL